MEENVIPFRPRARRDVAREPGPKADSQGRKLERLKKNPYGEAHDIQRDLSRRFSFDVMLKGMPHDGDALLQLTSKLRDGLLLAASRQGGDSALINLHGVHVFFSSARNEIRNDEGYCSLRLSNDFSAADVAALVTEMVRSRELH
jgi:hypothetical protein